MNENLDITRLIELIEAEVEKVLKEKGYTVNRSVRADENRRNILVIVTEGYVGQDEAVKQVEELAQNCKTSLEACPTVTVLLSQIAIKFFRIEQFSEMQGVSEVFTDDSDFDPMKLVNTSDLIIVPLLSFSTAAKLSLGIADSLSTNIILHSLMQSKPVIAARNSVELLDLEPTNPFVELSKDYINKITDLGMKLVDVSDIAKSVANYGSGRQTYEGNGSGKTVVTSSVISNLAEDVRELIIDNSAIVTALAQELANERGIKIRSEK